MKTKSFKRALAIIVSMLTLLSMLSVCFSVSAAVIPDYHIDESKKTSLTIYKYEMPDVTAATTGGTGEMTDKTTIPEGATPLSGVEFTIYKIADLDEYFTGEKTEYPSTDVAEAKSKEATTAKYVKVTDKNGIAQFTSLPQGIYYVKETNGPVQITKPIAPFVLSLPMTNADGTKWLYDVYSFPKNQTAYTDINVKKVDSKTGEPLENAEFTLYSSDNGETYEVYQEGIKTGSNGIATITAVPNNKYYKFVETKTSDESYILDSTIGYEFYVDATGDMIIDGKAVENNTLIVGNDSPAIHKYILDGEKGAEGIDNTANIGDTVYWKIKTDIPANVEKLTKYQVVDTMSKGLTYKDAEIYLDDETLLKEGEDYNVKPLASQVEFDFDTAKMKEKMADAKLVVIYYNTILNEEAPLATDIPNTSKLIYTNKIKTDSTYEKPSETPTVHTGGLQFRKTDGTDPLEGVEFKLYASEEDANSGENAIMTATSDKDGLVTFKGIAYGSFSADAEGKAANGVDGGSREYWVAETKGKEGFSLISAPIKMIVNNKSHLATNKVNDDVVNSRVPELPPTGGIGMTLVLTGAGALIAIGVLLLVVRRKKN